jgi:demethylmenaquinone methyltransferase / 2-methoxy-6-polyprenyl-1,4-benzoquinol methylase
LIECNFLHPEQTALVLKLLDLRIRFPTLPCDHMPDPVAVNSMFSRIARRYDSANRLLSGGIDQWWRRRLVRRVKAYSPNDLLDLATGSGDVAFALSRALPPTAHIIGMDFCQPMLDEAIAKQISDRRRGPNVKFQPGDGMALPCKDASFDAVTVSFGLRNMADRHKALSEMRRVLRPGGHLHVLEFSQPYRWFRPAYYFYTKRILPWVAGTITGDRAAYDYLNASIEAYPDHNDMKEELARAGFKRVFATRMSLGIVAMHTGEA